ncbi:MAG: hypothetical protein LBQ22_08455 [Bacteroidales bacterium]|jgi:hypothetical protein|nr:hypothetical protein [Bacteroidales bacterium]
MKKIITLFIFIFIVQYCFSADNDSVKPKPVRSYIGVYAGLGAGSIRDYSTSPLFYSALYALPRLDYSYYWNKNILYFDLKVLSGIYAVNINNNAYGGSGLILDFKTSYFRELPFKSTKLNLKQYWGASLSNYFDYRTNEAFMNAALIFDNFTTLEANYKFELRYTKKAKQKKILFIKYMRKEKNYLMALNVGIPFYSLIYRPGFSVVGNATVNDSKIFRGYELGNRFFPGLNTDFSIARVLNNGNMFKLSYCWDMFSTGKGSYYNLNSAKHLIMISLIVNLK